MYKSIFNYDKIINLSYNNWLDVMLKQKNNYEITKGYNVELDNIYKYMRKYGNAYNIFYKNINKYAFKDTVEVENFKEAEDLINNCIKFIDIFKKEIDEEFEDDMYIYKLKILKNNKLMFISPNSIFFNKNEKARIDKTNMCLTVIQLYKLINRINYYQKTIEYLCKELNIKIIGREMEIKMDERAKIINNLEVLENLEKYEYLYKFIKKNKFVLKALQLIALNNSYKSLEAKNDDLIFLSTSTYIHNYLQNIAEEIKNENTEEKVKVLSTNYIRKILLAYKILGLINIVEPTQNLIKMQNKNNLHNNSLLYFVMPLYNNSVLINADDIAKKLLDNNITTANITQKKVNEILYNIKIEKEKDNIGYILKNIDFTIN